MAEILSMFLGLQSLEDVFVRGRTVHMVGNGHRYYGNIECESAIEVMVEELSSPVDGVLGSMQEWALTVSIIPDEDMGRSGQERLHFRFTDRCQAESVREAFMQVSALVQGKQT